MESDSCLPPGEFLVFPFDGRIFIEDSVALLCLSFFATFFNLGDLNGGSYLSQRNTCDGFKEGLHNLWHDFKSVT